MILYFSKWWQKNEKDYPAESCQGYREASQALEMSGYPSQKTFNHMVRTINNFAVTIEYIQNSNTIYGFDVPTLKGKTVRQQPKRVQAEYVEVSDSLK